MAVVFFVWKISGLPPPTSNQQLDKMYLTLPSRIYLATYGLHVGIGQLHLKFETEVYKVIGFYMGL